jgi:single-stranded-DNA-specific exonuclease
MIQRKWKEQKWDRSAVDELAGQLNIEPLAAAILWLRDVRDIEEARIFISGEPFESHSPLLMTDMAKAAERLLDARKNSERVLVHGDYDVDGMSGAALVYDFLRRNGWDACVHVPHRIDEGYGISRERLESAAEEGIKLVVTVDCGSSAVDEVRYAKESGMDVVITDHHIPPDVLPEAVALVNPHLRDSKYPFPDLSGAGVGYKLCCAVVEFSDIDVAESDRLLDLVALGTLADMMPVLGENRSLIRRGLQLIPAVARPGIMALCESCRVNPEKVGSEDVAFMLAPRLNAAGRLSDPKISLDLITSDNGEEALDLTQDIERLNSERKSKEQDMQRQALNMAEEDPELGHRESIVLANKNWHRGVIGLVAGRLAEHMHLPTAILSIEGDKAYGSVRSAGGIDVTQCLSRCEFLLDRYGGHQAAAGFMLPSENISQFRDAFEVAVSSCGLDIEPTPTLPITATLTPERITSRLIDDLDLLAPYGEGHPRPIFAVRGVDLCGRVRVVGNSHLKAFIPAGTFPGQRAKLDMIGFGKGHLIDRLDWEKVDLAFALGFNQYRGETTIQLKLIDVRQHDTEEAETVFSPNTVSNAELHLHDYGRLPRVRRCLSRFLQAEQPVSLLLEGSPSGWLAAILEAMPTPPMRCDWANLADADSGSIEGSLAVISPPRSEDDLRNLGRCMKCGAEVHLFLTKAVINNQTKRIDAKCPDRAEMAKLYKSIKNHVNTLIDQERIKSLLIEEGYPARLVRLGLQVFVELEILAIDAEHRYYLHPRPQKRELTYSPTYKKLSQQVETELRWLSKLESLPSKEILNLMCPAQ